MVAMSMIPTSSGGSGGGTGGIRDLLTGTAGGTLKPRNDPTSVLGNIPNLLPRTTTTDPVTGQQDIIQSIYDLLGGGNILPSRDAAENRLNTLHGVTLDYENLARRTLMSDADLARRGLALDQSNIGIGRGAANRDLGAIAQLLGINDQSLNRNLNTVAQLLGLNTENLGNQISQVNLSEGINRRGLQDDSVARGAYNAPGTRQGFSDIEREAELARAAADIGARQTGVGLEDRAGGAREDHARTRIGLNRQAGDARDTLKRLDNEIARLGLTAEQVSNTLNIGLERLGLEHLTNTDDLLQKLNSNNVEHATMALNLIAQAAQMAGLGSIADIAGGLETVAGIGGN